MTSLIDQGNVWILLHNNLYSVDINTWQCMFYITFTTTVKSVSQNIVFDNLYLQKFKVYVRSLKITTENTYVLKGIFYRCSLKSTK